ncbi:Rpn family recombination-promoting nuclease/putative transposase [Leptospira sp. GIMC2001]|uniref:Rpn family recombination-promoting nuclease/putative transposase n=1 Tax=Leptospira sp. GIMC2001 TaxID=1513297 RepID=UPI00234A0F00|nr:Rpn family recombination-promoting nuclease/putative transposase [Leptospira sp. GIMC2001]WCL51382.1 Rpn family recombination-promoting nuclease/putative transposase [Leptospira sp. GIMC2001]
MSMKFFPLTNDLVFKSVFTKDPKLLISLINCILFPERKREIEELIILNPEIPTSFSKDKRSILDIRAKDTEGREFQVEVQVGFQGVFIKRSIFYLAGMIRDQLKEGDGYSELRAVYQINLVDFELFPSSDYFSKYSLREEKNPELRLTDDLEIVFLELPKFLKHLEELETELDYWIYLFKNSAKIEESEMKIVIDKAPNLENAFKILEYYSTDPEKRQKLEEKIRTDRDYAYDLAATYERGEIKGKLEGERLGIEKGKLEDARLMREEGIDLSVILRVTGLSESQLKENGIL